MTQEQELLEKWGVHDIVQKAIEHAHTTPAPATIEAIKGLTNMLTENKSDMKEAVNRLEKKIDDNTKITQEVRDKVAIQNGRVTTQEAWSKEAKIILDANTLAINNLEKDKAWQKGVAWVIAALMVIVPTVCTYVFGLYLKNRDYEINDKIKEGVESAFNSRFSKIEVINE